MNVVLVCSCLVFIALTGLVVGENIHDIICSQEFTGYKLDYARRRCIRRKAKGCVDPFPYKTKQECLNDFRGKNVCDTKPCRHGGLCMPVTTEKRGRTFKCDCFATGYYGRRCHRRCPKKLNRRSHMIVCLQIG